LADNPGSASPRGTVALTIGPHPPDKTDDVNKLFKRTAPTVDQEFIDGVSIINAKCLSDNSILTESS